MNSRIAEDRQRTGAWKAVVVLTLLCAAFYGYGLTAHGLRNWQEGQRALVAREMFRDGRWITPTVHGEPYIAKPPMMYWVSMTIGHARGALGFTPFADETEVRLAVALAATLGVLATFFVARRLLAPDHPDAQEDRLARQAAWWSALGLATGILYFRSARVGELDMLIVPFVVVAVGAIDAARRRMRVHGRLHLAALAIATLAGVGATLTKGPPALLVIALAGYAPILLRALGSCATSPFSRKLEIAGACLGGALLLLIPAREVDGPRAFVGLLCMGAMGALLGAWLARFARPGAPGAAFSALRPTHPLVVLGIPLLALWGWGQLVAREIGAETLAALAAAEVDNNLRMLVLESPAKNLGFFLYGVAPMSLAAIAGAIWLARERPTWGAAPARWTPLLWCALSFMAFSLLGKGVARYLTPAWPGVAMLGGLWLAWWLRDLARIRAGAQRQTVVIAGALLLAGVGQMWWYGSGRETLMGEHTPRELVREIRAQTPAGRIGAYELSFPGLDYYFDERVTLWERQPSRGGRSVEELIEIARTGPYILLSRRESPSVIRRFGSILERLRSAGLDVQEIPTEAVFLRRDEDATVVAFRITPPASTGADD